MWISGAPQAPDFRSESFLATPQFLPFPPTWCYALDMLIYVDNVVVGSIPEDSDITREKFPDGFGLHREIYIGPNEEAVFYWHGDEDALDTDSVESARLLGGFFPIK